MTLSALLSTFLFLSVLTAASPLTALSHPYSILHTNTTASPRLSQPLCINSAEWVTSSFLAGDCYTAIDKLHNRKTDIWGTIPLEFFAYRTAPTPPTIWVQQTPQRHKHKSCTLAVVMLGDLPPGVVPAGGYQHDVASYATIERAAREIVARCLSPVLGKGGAKPGGELGFSNPTGFDIVGQGHAIGVFLWDTGSSINQRIPRADATSID